MEKKGLAAPQTPRGLSPATPTRSRSRSRSPRPKKKKNKAAGNGNAAGTAVAVNRPVPPGGSQGVGDYDIFNLPVSDYKYMLALTAIAVVVRLYKIDYPTSVVFDEVHFGGFATKYIKGRFFMDVHPPLAKLLITLAGWLAGFNGNFDFKEIGKDYLAPGVPYVAMRMLPALMGIAVVPMCFLTLKAAGCATITAILGSGLITFENGLITQSRLILLDSPLMFFTAFTALSWFSFQNVHEQGHAKHFSAIWWFWLIMTGLGLGATASVKWVGLFTIAWVGALTVLQLWLLLGDTKNVPARLWFKHFFARASALIVLPIAFYMAMFAIHFTCLVNPGDGDGFMSSEFQSTLRGKGMQAVPADVAFGSRVAIRHWNTQGGYLHSHNHMYPTGSKQQQITLYPHQDENNVFVFENETMREGGIGIGGFDDLSPPAFIKNGDKVRLYHAVTDRRLHSHDVRPPITEADWQFEVSAYGYKGFDGDANDIWRVEIIPSLSEKGVAQERVRTIHTKFKLVHVMTGCVLFSHKVKLPSWGFEQQEVTCARGATLPNSVWYVEQNHHVQLGDDAEKVNYRRPGFLSKFWELNKVMWRTNAGLTDSHAWDSRPDSWPVLRRGINFWGRENRQVYLIGNPFIWWSSTLAVVVYVIFKGIAVLRWQRGYSDYSITNFKRFDYEIGTSVLAWALHYFPFFLMQRQLFLHHYFPALYFAVIALCQTFDFTTRRVQAFGIAKKPALSWGAALAYLLISIVVFYLLSPLAYGLPWTKAECRRVKLLPRWDWDCNTFHDSYDKYSVSTSLGGASPTPTDAVKPANPPPVQDPKQPETVQDPQAIVSPPPEEDGAVIHERVEYRDQDGNLLNEEQIKALGDDVQFETRYETRYVDDIAAEGIVAEAIKEQQQREEEPESIAPAEPVAVEAETPAAEVKDENTVPAEAPIVEEKTPAVEKVVPAEEQEEEVPAAAEPVAVKEETPKADAKAPAEDVPVVEAQAPVVDTNAEEEEEKVAEKAVPQEDPVPEASDPAAMEKPVQEVIKEAVDEATAHAPIPPPNPPSAPSPSHHDTNPDTNPPRHPRGHIGPDGIETIELAEGEVPVGVEGVDYIVETRTRTVAVVVGEDGEEEEDEGYTEPVVGRAGVGTGVVGVEAEVTG